MPVKAAGIPCESDPTWADWMAGVERELAEV